MYKSKNVYSKHNISFLVLLVVAILSFCVAIGTVLAWLKVSYTEEDENSRLGYVALAIYANGNQLVSSNVDDVNSGKLANATPYLLPTTGTTKSINLKIRNIGTIDALVRATISIYSLNGNGDKELLLKSTSSIVHTGWVDALNPYTIGGYLFYDNPLSPYVINGETKAQNEISIVSSVTVPNALASKQLYMDVSLDACALAGNIYKKIKEGKTDPASIPVMAYPFGTTLPDGWDVWDY